ncbi:MAG: hypothetical protein HWN68_04460 [Desulfobacterales bacterium]|nr:hypothetical protein [Desulfobacterales bacterium]
MPDAGCRMPDICLLEYKPARHRLASDEAGGSESFNCYRASGISRKRFSAKVALSEA